MSTATLMPPRTETLESPALTERTLADLLFELGDIPPNRIRTSPPIGGATKEDVLELHDRENRLFELVDGVLVEKVMAFYESRVAAVLVRLTDAHASNHDLGIVTCPDGMIQLAPGLVRMPDVAFMAWNQFPDRKLPDDPIPGLYPNLAVEVLSKSNTRKEMERKVREYFSAGSEMVWLIDPESKTAQVFRSPEDIRVVDSDGALDGEDVLPGFQLPLAELFQRVGKRTRDS